MKNLTLLFCLITCTTVSAQLFTPAYDLFSIKEPAYINLEDGTRIEGTVNSISRKNGLIKSITLTPAGEKKKLSIKSEVISNMYLPVSSFNKFDNSVNRAFNKRFGHKTLDTDKTDRGYAYFEKTRVVKNAEVEELLLQLLNPSFSNKIRVYHIPLAKQTVSTELAGVTITHNEDKSYFIKVGDATAVKLRKKDYDDAYAALYKDCPSLLQQLKGNHRWAKFDEHLYEYSTQCK